MQLRQSVRAPKRASKQVPQVRFLSSERLGVRRRRFVMALESPDQAPRIVTALRTPHAFTWAQDPPPPSPAPQPAPAASNDPQFDRYLRFLAQVYAGGRR